jgi:hypothetical protein
MMYAESADVAGYRRALAVADYFRYRAQEGVIRNDKPCRHSNGRLSELEAELQWLSSESHSIGGC